MQRGEIWVANLNPPRGREIGKVRPVLVVQASELDETVTPMVVVLPVSSQLREDFRHLRVLVPARERLLKPCQVIVDQPRALDRRRIGEGPLARLSTGEMAAVERGLKVVLGLL
jgi:mRNA interferase MazF